MLAHIFAFLSRYMPKNETGQDLTEYALLVALIAIIVILAIVFFGEQLSTFFSSIGDILESWLTPGAG